VAGGRDHVRVSNEFQLCVDPTADLFLRVISLTEDPVNGLALPAVTQRVRSELASDPASLLSFEEKLAAAGYSDAHFASLAAIPYRVTLCRVYKVTSSMPSICARNLQAGVMHVSYDLDLRECTANLIAEAEFLDSVQHAVQMHGAPAL
jgi:hypothetical protein